MLNSIQLICTPHNEPLFYDISHELQFNFLIAHGVNKILNFNKKLSGENHCFLHPDQNGILKPVNSKNIREFIDEQNKLQEDIEKVVENGVERYDLELRDEFNG